MMPYTKLQDKAKFEAVEIISPSLGVKVKAYKDIETGKVFYDAEDFCKKSGFKRAMADEIARSQNGYKVIHEIEVKKGN